MSRYPFLSDDWLEEARKIRAEYKDRVPPITVSVRMNQVIKEVPFGDGTINAHVDTSSGEMEMDIGHLDAPDLTVTVPYDVAKAILVSNDAQAGMQAFLGGKIRVDGDVTKMMALQTAGAAGANDPIAQELAKRLQEITE